MAAAAQATHARTHALASAMRWTRVHPCCAGIEGLRGLCVPKAVCEDRFPWLMKSSLPPPWQYPVQVRACARAGASRPAHCPALPLPLS